MNSVLSPKHFIWHFISFIRTFTLTNPSCYSASNTMSEKKDNNGGASSVVLYESYKPLMSPSSSQPFIFQQYTVRETVTPTKLGNVSMKEVSFSMCHGGAAAAASALSLSFSSTASPKKQLRNRHLPMLLQKPLPSSTKVTDFSNTTTEPVEKHLKHRNRNTNPFKRVKVDLVDENHKKSRSHHKHSTKCSSKVQLKESKELDWRSIFIISLLPLVVSLVLVRNFWPCNDENIIVQDSLIDSAEEELIFSNLEPIKKTLNQQVFGQEAAISSLLKILDGFINKDMLKNKQMPVILLSGSSGVGKSLISSILIENYPAPGKTKLVHWPAPKPELILKKFSESHLNLVVIDSLNLNSMTQAINWAKKLFNEALWQNKPIIAMLTLNVQVWNGALIDEGNGTPHSLEAKSDIFHKKLQLSGVDSHHVHLNVLTQENVKDCIRVALMKRGLLLNGQISENHVSSISEHINSRLEGCNSVWNRSASVAF